MRSLLAAYDAELRTWLPSALSVARHGPLLLATMPGARGFVTYPHVTGVDRGTAARWVEATLDHWHGDPAVTHVSWKVRGHDGVAGLHEELVDHGFVPGEAEAVMLGALAPLATDDPVPEGVTLRTVTAEAEVRQMCRMLDHAFGEDISEGLTAGLLRRQVVDPLMELWVAEADGEMVSAGRLEPVPGSRFAGVWGGATLPQWRGRGIYRALTVARARSALAAGWTHVHSDSTPYSQPILERSGLVQVTTTTPYRWHR